jgi:hypothetical protein
VRVQDVDVGELQARKGGGGAFDEVFARDAKVVDFGAGTFVGGVVRAPVDLRISSKHGVALRIARSDLGRHHNVAAVPAKVLDGATHYFLRLACRVTLGAVEEVDARIVGGFKARKGVVVADVAAVC